MRLDNFNKNKAIKFFLMSIFLLLFVTAGALFSGKTIIMQYLDYECNPIAGESFIIEDYKSNFLAGNSVSTSEVITDKNGYATLTRHHDSYFKIINKKNWESPWYGNRNRSYVRDLTRDALFGDAELREAFTSSLENPLVVYPYHTYPFGKFRYLTKAEVEFSKDRFNKNNKLEYQLSGESGSHQDVAKLIISREDKFYAIAAYGQRGGGLIEVEQKNLPFDATLPTQGYQRHYEFVIPEATVFPAQTQRAFYFKSDNEKEYGTLVLSFTVAHESLVINSFIDSVFLDPHSEKEPIQLPVVIPQEACGGVAARHYNGYYGRISKFSRLLKTIEQKHRNKIKYVHTKEKYTSDRQLLIEKARDIHTEDSWFAQLGPDPYIGLVAIDNNAPIQSRLETLYDINHETNHEGKSESSHYSQLMERIAGDARTPPHVLRDMYELNVSERINWEIMRNPQTPTYIADNILRTLTQKILKAPPENSEPSYMYFYHYAFDVNYKNSISSRALNDSILILAERLAQGSAWYVYPDERVSSQSISAIWEARKRQNKHDTYSDTFALTTNINTPLPVLLDVYEYSVKEPWYENNERTLIRLLDNPGFPIEVFYELKSNYNHLAISHVLACSKRTPPDILSALASENHSNSIINCIAKNPGTPLSTLLKLPQKHLGTVIKNPSVSEQDFFSIFDNFTNIPLLRRHATSLLKSPRTPAHVIRIIHDNSWASTSSYFVDNPNTPLEVLIALYGKNDILDEKIARHPNVSEELVLDMINNAQIAAITLAVASNTATPEHVLWRLFRDEFVVTDEVLGSDKLAEALYCNSSTPKEIRYQLPYMANYECTKH